MAVRWKIEVTQVGSSYSVEDIRGIIGPGVGATGGALDLPVYVFSFDSEQEARAAEDAIMKNTSGVHTRVESFDPKRS